MGNKAIWRSGCSAVLALVVLAPAGGAEPARESTLAKVRELVETDPRGAEAALEFLLKGDLSAPQRVDALVLKGRALVSLGRLEEAGRTADEAVHLAAGLQDEARRLDGETVRCGVLAFQGHYAEALEPTRQAYQKARALGLKPQEARLANLLGAVHNFNGQVVLAIDYYLNALRLAEELGEKRTRLQILHNLGGLYLVSHSTDKCLSTLEQALPEARKSGGPELLAGLLVTKASALEQAGRVPEEVQALEEALEVSRRSGLIRVEATALANLADLNLTLGHFEKAKAMAEQAQVLCGEMGDRFQQLTTKVTQAQAMAHLGHRDQAIQIMREALAAFQQGGHPLEVMQLQGILAETLEAAGRYREALDVYKAFKASSDGVMQKEGQNAIARFREQYEAERREREIEDLTVENRVQTAELKRRRIQHLLTVGGIVSLAVIVALLAMRQRAVKRTQRQLRELNARLEELSLTDPLTGLWNRRYFETRIEDEAAHARRQAQAGESVRLGMLLLDIDHFKPLNDTEGHVVGDQVLRILGQRFAETLRQSDITIRWGGEEFLVLSRETTEEGLRDLAMRVLEAVNGAPFEAGGKLLRVTCSIGFCLYPIGGDLDWKQALEVADWALYRAKDGGRDCAVGVQAGPGLQGGQGREVLGNLEESLAQGLLQLV
nr:diguanylate cyclase [uncultured Holophaga sp.]